MCNCPSFSTRETTSATFLYTTSLLITRKLQPQLHPPLEMNSITLKEASTHKHLGITFSSSCTWSEHINNITDTAWKRFNIIRTLKFKISRLALEKLYTVYVRPLLEYSDSVWDNCSNDCKRQLESIHNEAARIVSGATKLCSIETMLADLG